ncbi:MAG: preprotein translocase subunit YajC [Firmicutes bacterium]|nr:preprotein translocase subunit YajC [Bacillota bacterium]
MTIQSIITLAVTFGLMWLFFIRPEQKKEKEKDDMRNNVKVGDQITTIGGIVGRITKVNEDTIIIQTGADRVRIEVKRWAIGSIGADEPVTASDSAKKEARRRKKEAEAEAEAAGKPSSRQIRKLGSQKETEEIAPQAAPEEPSETETSQEEK